jgi:MFS superfamily sulfate permease-like transporter
VLGFSVPSGSIVQTASGLMRGMSDGKTNETACAIGFACLALIFACKRWAPRWPGVLFAVVGASLVVALFDLSAQAQIAVVGTLPQGLPTFHIPQLTLNEFYTLCTGAVAIALVSIADMSVLSRIYALRGSYYVDDNQEIIALGLANVTTGLFQGFSVSSSASRTPVAEAAGARTQVTGVVGAICIALLLMLAPALMRHVPTAALGAVVISASWTILEIAGVRRLYQLRRGEFVLANVCFLGVAMVGVIQGIFIAVGLSLLVFIWRAWRPYHAILGRVDGMKGYHDITRHPDAKRIPGLILFRWDAPLFFANAEKFREHVLRGVSNALTQTRWIVVAAEPVTDVDITSADMLTELEGELMKGPVKDRLKTYGLFDTIGAERFFPTVGQAVDRYVDLNQVDWTDWEDSKPQ